MEFTLVHATQPARFLFQAGKSLFNLVAVYSPNLDGNRPRLSLKLCQVLLKVQVQVATLHINTQGVIACPLKGRQFTLACGALGDP